MDTTPHTEITAFLDRYADALAAGDLPGIAACYAVPALVVGDAATIPVAEAAQVEAAFAGAADAYRAQDLVGVRPELWEHVAGPAEIAYLFEVTDPSLFTRPWRGEMVFRATDAPMYDSSRISA